jgi:glycosyltransferase involved in cell wall biosynthesis
VIQHFPPLYRSVSNHHGIDLRVFYASKAGLQPYTDSGFGETVAWDSDLTSGYDYEFLPSATALLPQGFWSTTGAGMEARLRAFRPDLVFVFGYTPALMLRAMLYALVRRIPVAMMTDSELLHARAGWRVALKRLLLPSLFARISAFFTIGDNNEAYLKHYGVAQQRMVRGGYPTDEGFFLAARTNRLELRARARNAWSLDDDDFVMLCVGKLIRRKRPEDVLSAAGQVALPGRKIAVVYAGDGELRPLLEARAAQTPNVKVRFLGFVNQSGLPSAYAGADVLVHPAEFDAHPLTITEATMVGVPVLVSDRVGAVGPTDTAQPGRNARVYPVGDTSALARLVDELLLDEQQLIRMREATADVAAETGLSACVDGMVRLVGLCTQPASLAPARAGRDHV